MEAGISGNYCTGSGASRSAHPDSDRWRRSEKMDGINKRHRGGRQSADHAWRSRRRTSREVVENCPGDVKNLIPANIRHKYGSSMVEQLLTPEQVRTRLRETEERRGNVTEVYIPNVTREPWLVEDFPHKVYYELSHCLRSNLFPGMPINRPSLVQDSYTAEVNERGRLDRSTAQHWYGRKTDDLALWSQELIERNTIAKILETQQKPSSRNVPPVARVKVPRNDPPPLPTQQPKKLKQQRKTQKLKVQPPPLPEPEEPTVTKPEQDDNFWDFYEKPIP